MSDQKTEQAEWEVVDTIGPQQASPKASRAALLRTMLGPWWRWKVAALIVSLAILVAFVFAVAGVLFVVGLVVVLAMLVIAKVKQLLRQSSSSLTR